MTILEKDDEFPGYINESLVFRTKKDNKGVYSTYLNNKQDLGTIPNTWER